MLKTVLEYTGKFTSSLCEIFIGLLVGASDRLSLNAIAKSRRNAELMIDAHSGWDKAAQNGACIGRSREFFLLRKRMRHRSLM